MTKLHCKWLDSALNATPRAVEGWIPGPVQAMMADTDWELAASRPDASLFYRACPWGGHLIKIDLKKLGEYLPKAVSYSMCRRCLKRPEKI